MRKRKQEISRQSIDACKNYFRDDLVKTDWQLMVELKKLFEIIARKRKSRSSAGILDVSKADSCNTTHSNTGLSQQTFCQSLPPDRKKEIPVQAVSCGTSYHCEYPILGQSGLTKLHGPPGS
uniref:Uncharacterized protein n=1 Tax=Timema tahoe TaxID=61484 RepID=A0A7R9IN36_9NEOP|nr:unnamed protein product [Timema tahoe]